jgi:cardiolipin synthase
MATPTTEPARPATVHRGEDRILTVPNAITTVRLLCVPLFLWLMLRSPDHRGWYPAALLLGALGATDGVDGYVARHFHQVSTLGKVLDPIADRLLLGAAAISAIALGAVPLSVGLPAIGREALVAVGFLIVAALGGRRMDVVWLGKAGTFGLMVALPLFLVGHANDDWHALAETGAWIAAVPALVLGWAAVAIYVPEARAAVAEGRRERDASSAPPARREGADR